MSKLIRSAVWRLHKRLNDYVIADTGRERFVVSTDDTYIGERLYTHGAFDFEKFEGALHYIEAFKRPRPNLLLDVGANIGPICIPAIKRGLVERAIAIEPEPLNATLLRTNVALNGLAHRIEVIESAAGAKDGETPELSICEGNRGDHRIRADGDERAAIKVASSTLDTLCPDTDQRTLLWMDTQGFEGFVLSGAKRILQSLPPLVAEFWPYLIKRAGSLQPFVEAVSGYSCFIDLELGGRRPIGDLRAFYDERGEAWASGTDLLFL